MPNQIVYSVLWIVDFASWFSIVYKITCISSVIFVCLSWDFITFYFIRVIIVFIRYTLSSNSLQRCNLAEIAHIFSSAWKHLSFECPTEIWSTRSSNLSFSEWPSNLLEQIIKLTQRHTSKLLHMRYQYFIRGNRTFFQCLLLCD